jgi:hypothetical protein
MFVVGDAMRPAQQRHRVYSHGLLPARQAGNWITGYMGREYKDKALPAAQCPLPASDQVFPMAYLVEQDPGSYLRPHFHVADQFQVFVAGEGSLGGEEIKPISFHFVGRRSPYGPIAAGASGLHYFTLRNGFDPGSRFMPDCRAELPRERVFRQTFGGPIDMVSPTDLGKGTRSCVEPVLAQEPDGLAVWRYLLRPDDVEAAPSPAAAGGQHFLVLAGELILRGQPLRQDSCIFLSPDEDALILRAGQTGTHLLLFQYPFVRH